MISSSKKQIPKPPFTVENELSTRNTPFGPHLGPNCCDLVETPKLQLIKSMIPEDYIIHYGMDNLQVTLELKNPGVVPIYNITVTDKLDPLYEYIAGSIAGGDRQDDSDPRVKGLTWFVGFLDKKSSVFLTFEVRAADVTMPQIVSNIAYANSEATGEVPSNQIDKLIVVTKREFVITKRIEPTGLLNFDDEITYFIEVTNIGWVDADNVTITDSVPLEFTYIPGSMAGTDTMNESNPVSPGLVWSLPVLKEMSSVEVSYKARVKHFRVPTTVVNTAYVAAPKYPTTTSNEVISQIIPPVPDLSIVKRMFVGGEGDWGNENAINPPEVYFDQTYDFALTVENNSAFPAYDVKVTDRVQWPFVYEPGTIQGGDTRNDSDPTGTGLVWTISTLEPGTSVKLIFRIRIAEVLVDTEARNFGTLEAENMPSEDSNEIVTLVKPAIPQLTLLKSIVPDTYEVEYGEIREFQLTVTNTGKTKARNVIITDRVTEPWFYQPGTIRGGTTRDESDPTGAGLKWTLTELDPGATHVFSFKVMAGEVHVETLAKNFFTLEADNKVPEDSNEIINIIKPAVPQLTIVKSIEPDLPTAEYGDVRTFHLTVTNTGPTNAMNVVVRDSVVFPWVYNQGSITGGDDRQETVVDGTPILIWKDFKMAPGEVQVFSFTVTAGEVHEDTIARNSAFITADNKKEEESNEIPTIIKPAKPNLNIVKAIIPDTPTAEYQESRLFNITVSNVGETTAKNIVVTDIVQWPWIYTAGSIGGGDSRNDSDPTGNGLIWTLTELLPGMSHVFAFSVTAAEVHEPTLAKNGAILNADNFEEKESNETETTILPAKPNLSIIKTIIPDTPTAEYNETREFNLTVRNNGASTAKNVVVRDTVQWPWIYNIGSIAGGQYRQENVDNGVYTLQWSKGEMAPGEVMVLSFRVTAAEVDEDTVARNVAILSADNKDDEESNEIPTIVIPPKPNLSIVKSIIPNTPTAEYNETREFNLTVRNNGATTAKNVVVRDTVEWPWIYNVGSIGGGESRQENVNNGVYTLQWSKAAMAPGEVMVLSFKVTAAEVEEETIARNVAILSADNKDDEESNEIPTTILPAKPNLSIVKSIIPNTPTAQFNEVRDFNLTVRNNGSSTAKNIVVRDTVKWPWIYNVGSMGGGDSRQEIVNTGVYTLQWSKAEMAPGEVMVLSFRVTAAEVQQNTVARNSAIITADNKDDEESNETVTTIIPPKPNLSIVKSVVPDLPTATSGDVRTFNLTVRNNGATQANNIRITDVVKYPWKYNAASISGGDTRNDSDPTGVGLRWTLGKLLPGQSHVFSFSVTAAEVAVTTNAYNKAVMDSDNNDRQESNEIVIPILPPTPNLTIVKTIEPTTKPVYSGEQRTFRLTVSNVGTTTAHNIVVTDKVNWPWRYNAGSISGGDSRNDSDPTGAGLRWTRTVLAPSQSIVFSFGVTAELVTEDTLARNVAILSSDNKDDEESNEDQTIIKPLTPRLAIEKAISPTTNPVRFNEERTFTLTLRNTGLTPAKNITISDKVQWPWEYISGSITGGDSNNASAPTTALTWTFATLNPGDMRQVSFRVRALQVTSNTKAHNFATVTADNMNQLTSNEIIRDILVPVINASISKSISPTTDPVPSGETRTFTLVVRNNSEITLTNLVVRDIVRYPWIYQSGSMTGGNATNQSSPTGTGLEWTINSLTPNQSVNLTFRVTAAEVNVYTSVYNNATLQNSQIGTVQSNTIYNTIVPSVPSLTITKSSNPTSTNVYYYSQLTYILTVRNTGSVTATNIQVTDLVNSYWSYIRGSISGGTSRNETYPYNYSGLTWTIASLAAGATATLSFRVQPYYSNCSVPYSIYNQAYMSADRFNRVASNTLVKTIVFYYYKEDGTLVSGEVQ